MFISDNDALIGNEKINNSGIVIGDVINITKTSIDSIFIGKYRVVDIYPSAYLMRRLDGHGYNIFIPKSSLMCKDTIQWMFDFAG